MAVKSSLEEQKRFSVVLGVSQFCPTLEGLRFDQLDPCGYTTGTNQRGYTSPAERVFLVLIVLPRYEHLR